MPALDQKKIFPPSHRTRIIGREGEVHQTLASTMDAAKECAGEGVSDGYVVVAEQQTAGRGRDGAWQCPAGKGLLLTVVLKMGLRRSRRKLISYLGPVAVVETFEDFGCPARIKWPNDIVVVEPGPELHLRKLGGVLVEQLSRGDAAPTHLLGIGLNLNQTPDELPMATKLPATSLAAERPDGAVDRTRLCQRLLEKLDSHYHQLRLGRFEELVNRWRSLNCLLHRQIRARVDDRIISGKVTDLRSTGEIEVRLPDGRLKSLPPERTTLLTGSSDGN
jgi:BirA family biotin operon repressor/biotin-[acetyl-CoA-carboxylase] ligase